MKRKVIPAEGYSVTNPDTGKPFKGATQVQDSKALDRLIQCGLVIDVNAAKEPDEAGKADGGEDGKDSGTE